MFTCARFTTIRSDDRALEHQFSSCQNHHGTWTADIPPQGTLSSTYQLSVLRRFYNTLSCMTRKNDASLRPSLKPPTTQNPKLTFLCTTSYSVCVHAYCESSFRHSSTLQLDVWGSLCYQPHEGGGMCHRWIVFFFAVNDHDHAWRHDVVEQMVSRLV